MIRNFITIQEYNPIWLYLFGIRCASHHLPGLRPKKSITACRWLLFSFCTR